MRTEQTTEVANCIAVLQESGIRPDRHNEEWWFSVVDVYATLPGSVDAGAYLRKLKRCFNADGCQPVAFFRGLKLH